MHTPTSPAHDTTSLVYGLAHFLAICDEEGWAFDGSDSDRARSIISSYLSKAGGALASMPITPGPNPALASRVTDRLTEAWGWPADEPEAVRLGVNIARAASLLVAGTRATPTDVLDALIEGPTTTVPAVTTAPLKPTRDALAAAIYATRRPDWDTMPKDLQERWRKYADHINDNLPGRSEQEVKAEALNEAAAALDALQTPEEGLPAHIRRDPSLWISLLADEVAARP